MIEFPRTADATARAKYACRREGIAARSVTSRYLPDQSRFRTTVLLPSNTCAAALSQIRSILAREGFGDISVGDFPVVTVTMFSGLLGTVSSPAGELARRALVDRLPESYSADEVSAMSDDEAIAVAASCGLMEG